MEKLTATTVPLAEAQAIVCTGLNDDRTETVTDYAGVWRAGATSDCVRVRQSGSRRRWSGENTIVCAGA